MSALGVLGVGISLYAIHVKQQKLLLEEDYQALCDSESFSCSLVLTSEYSSLLSYWSLVDKYSTLDWSNAHLGVVVYTLFALYPVARLMPYHAHFYVFVSVCAAVVMMYLAYALVFVLHDLCLLDMQSVEFMDAPRKIRTYERIVEEEGSAMDPSMHDVYEITEVFKLTSRGFR
ncbi:hypothetical protein BBJ29_006498 [Phytophthora kernoviae]|uniref:vitamin-K-epoxide reductase (warfarin-sensitive) n=1 Tax=Phytophthora kernoviae TaxID=325452 RepID=A0A3F2RUD0_9STRA|nr:hypothetical protein BBJ29_006498 [Phytophthora kernoviae]RLN64445.1 hypothetical protein BBP00_00003447 [Phytophthora kernoviae]